MSSIAAFFGRLMLAAIFIIAGAGKLGDLAGTDHYIQSVGMPAGLALPAAIFELVAGLAIALGVMTRFFSLLLAGFCLLTAVLFHNNFADQTNSIMFMKNVAIAGGFLCLFAQSHLHWSYDAIRVRRKAELATAEADAARHDAELRAAKAEGHADALRSPAVAVPAAVTSPPVGIDPAVGIDRNRDGIDDRAQTFAPAPVVTPTVHDRDGDGIDDRAEPIDPRLRP